LVNSVNTVFVSVRENVHVHEHVSCGSVILVRKEVTQAVQWYL